MLWKSGILPVYLVCGEEDRLKEEVVDALVRKVVSLDFADFDLEKMSASDTTADAILAAGAQVPFGSEKRLVVVRGMEGWRDRTKSNEVDRLAEGLSRSADATCFVLVVAAEEEEAKRKIAVSVKLDNVVKKVGAMVACKGLSHEALLEWVRYQVGNAEKKIMLDAAELLIETVGTEMLALESEIIKLICYVGERETITGQDVAILVAASPEDVMFTTIDAISRRQTDLALTLLYELHRFDPKPQAVAARLLSLLARQYRMLWQAKFLAEKRVNPREVRALPPDIAAELPNESHIAQLAFKATDLFALSRSYEWEQLTWAMERLLLCDLANKGGVTEESDTFGGDPASNLQILVLELTCIARTRARATNT